MYLEIREEDEGDLRIIASGFYSEHLKRSLAALILSLGILLILELQIQHTLFCPPCSNTPLPWYFSDDDDCHEGNAPLFLVLGGGIILATTALKLIAYLTPCEYDDQIMVIMSPVADFANLCVIIWGSIVIFGKSSFLFPSWKSLQKSCRSWSFFIFFQSTVMSGLAYFPFL